MMFAVLLAAGCTAAAAKAGCWNDTSPMAVTREFLGVGVVNGTLYAMGGFSMDYYPDAYLASMEAYDPSTHR